MMKVYELFFLKSNYDKVCNGFEIGVFSSISKIEEVVQRYSFEIPGFKEFQDGCYQIYEHIISDKYIENNLIYQVVGWDWDEDGNEINIIRSSFYGNSQNAENELCQLQQNLIRQEWVLNRCPLNSCHWTEGFVAKQ